MNNETNYPPSGCRWCGIGKQSHCRGWTEEVGMHGYEHPTTDQIKARMLARRAARHHDNPRGTTVSDKITDDVIRDMTEQVILSSISDIDYMSIGELMQGDPRFNELAQDEFDAAQT